MKGRFSRSPRTNKTESVPPRRRGRGRVWTGEKWRVTVCRPLYQKGDYRIGTGWAKGGPLYGILPPLDPKIHLRAKVRSWGKAQSAREGRVTPGEESISTKEVRKGRKKPAVVDEGKHNPVDVYVEKETLGT